MENKHSFTFDFFENLSIGDVFKFSPIIDNDYPSKFYTVFYKDELITKINSTYGKRILRFEFSNTMQREVMIFPKRKRSIN